MSRLAQAWRNLPTVSAKFLIILIPILLLTTVGFSSIFFYFKYKDLRAVLEQRIAAIADINAVALSSSLWAFDVPSTQSIIQAISVNQELRCIQVSDDLAGTSYGWPESGCPRDAAGNAVRRDIHVQRRRLGSITLVYTYDSVARQIEAEILNTVWLLLLVLAGTTAGAAAAHRLTIGTPLNRLIASIRASDGQNQRSRVEWSSADEMGRVIDAYNRMLGRLEVEEAALRQSEERLGLAIRATRSSVWDRDLRTRVFWWSPEFPELLGFAPSELDVSTLAWESLVHPLDLPRVKQAALRHIRGETPLFRAVYRARRKDGDWAWLEDQATAIRDGDGTAIRLTGTISDVTERVQATEDLARERNILQITLDNVDQGVLMVDRDLRLVLYNRRAAELLNVPTEFLESRPSYPEIVDLQHDRGEFAEGDDPDLHYHRVVECSFAASTFKRRRPNASVVEVRSNPLNEGGFVRTFTDITVEARSAEEVFNAMQQLEQAYAELKETQASLVQAEKMASLALLVAGVAHEINTPVGIAYGCATHLSARTRTLVEAFEGGRMKRSDLTLYVAAASEAARLIEQNLTRAADLIQSFKRVAVDQTSQDQRPFDLATTLSETVTSLGPQLRPHGHAVAIDCPDGIGMNSFPGALSQVITNLIMNAVTHAYGERTGGRMTLAVQELADDEVEIRFTDDGRGIPPAVLPRIFEPFFTTRRGSGGSGLGLHIVFNLVTQSLGGRITVDSTPGVGTSFAMRFPRAPTPRTGAGTGVNHEEAQDCGA